MNLNKKIGGLLTLGVGAAAIIGSNYINPDVFDAKKGIPTGIERTVDYKTRTVDPEDYSIGVQHGYKTNKSGLPRLEHVREGLEYDVRNSCFNNNKDVNCAELKLPENWKESVYPMIDRNGDKILDFWEISNYISKENFYSEIELRKSALRYSESVSEALKGTQDKTNVILDALQKMTEAIGSFGVSGSEEALQQFDDVKKNIGQFSFKDLDKLFAAERESIRQSERSLGRDWKRHFDELYSSFQYHK